VGLLCLSLQQTITAEYLFFYRMGFSVPVWEALGVMSIVWGLALFLAAFGLFKGKSWAFIVTFVVSLLGMVFPVSLFVALQDYTILRLAVALAFSIPNGMVFIYLWRKNVMVFFYWQERLKRKPPSKRRDRPLGVTIVAILTLLGGIGAVIGGLLYAAWGRTLDQILAPTHLSVYPMFQLWGAVLIAAGVVSFLIPYGLLKRKRWGYWLTFTFNCLGFFFGGFFTTYRVDHFSLGYPGIILFFTDFLIFVYLCISIDARKFFGVGPRLEPE